MTQARVLIAEDDHDVLFMLRAVFALRGIEVICTAMDGFEAVTLAQIYRPDVVVLDLMMPKLSGDQAAGAIRVVSPDSKIVLLSAIPESALKRVALECGADAYVFKGDLDRLESVIESLAPVAV